MSLNSGSDAEDRQFMSKTDMIFSLIFYWLQWEEETIKPAIIMMYGKHFDRKNKERVPLASLVRESFPEIVISKPELKWRN